MSVSIQGVGGRKVTMDGSNIGCPDSVFMIGPTGRCIEFSRREFISAVKAEFNLYEDVEVSIAELLAAV